MKTLTEAVKATYASDRLAVGLLKQLQAAGHDLKALSTDDLIAFDELHVMGRKATIALGKMAGLTKSMHVLDIGSGLGGPARTLAGQFGCRVTGVDLSEEFVAASMELNKRVGLAGRVDCRHGNALALPFEESCFDAAFMIHVNMNIEDKKTLFQEARRVLKTGAKLVLWEICTGSAPGFIYPVPWADDGTFSFLVPMNAMADLLKASGFKALRIEDATDEAIQWVRARQAAMKNHKPKAPKLDLDLVIHNFRLKRINISKNLMQGSVRIVRAVATRSR